MHCHDHFFSFLSIFHSCHHYHHYYFVKMGLLDCLSMMTIVGEDAKRELLEHFRLSHDIAEKDVEAFVQSHVLLRSCRWRIMTTMWRMFQRQVKVLTNHGVKLWCDHCSLPAVVNWSFATGSWTCGSCGPQVYYHGHGLLAATFLSVARGVTMVKI